jgi:hypothetical protein
MLAECQDALQLSNARLVGKPAVWAQDLEERILAESLIECGCRLNECVGLLATIESKVTCPKSRLFGQVESATLKISGD